MKGYTGVLPDGEAVHYVDKKRWFWLLSVTYPLQVFIPLWLHSATGNELWFVLPFVINFVLLPVLDTLIGEDESNTYIKPLVTSKMTTEGKKKIQNNANTISSRIPKIPP